MLSDPAVGGESCAQDSKMRLPSDQQILRTKTVDLGHSSRLDERRYGLHGEPKDLQQCFSDEVAPWRDDICYGNGSRHAFVVERELPGSHRPRSQDKLDE